jgi:1-acyl-sn-glycerol-3-phosphate acyltransferase
MLKILAYPITLIYFICFGLSLVVFHPIQWLCFNVFGYKAHKISVDWLQFFLMRSLNVLGTRFSFNNPHQIPLGVPLILVANHQSMYDIPPIIWYLRKHHVKFISKKELGKGIPSVSYNLRHGGSVMIDRRDAIGSIKAIEEFAERIRDRKWAAVIFPEGTRSRDGHPKAFKTKGLKTMIQHIPNGLIVPITINNSWKVLKYGQFPLGLGAHIRFQVHEPVDIASIKDLDLTIREVENTIVSSIELPDE